MVLLLLLLHHYSHMYDVTIVVGSQGMAVVLRCLVQT